MSTSHLGPVLILCQDPFPCMDTVLCQGAGGGGSSSLHCSSSFHTVSLKTTL